MCDLSSDVNNTPKTNDQSVKTRAEIYIGNAIEYDVKSYQVTTTILKFTKLGIKGLNFIRSQKKMWVCPTVM